MAVSRRACSALSTMGNCTRWLPRGRSCRSSAPLARYWLAAAARSMCSVVLRLALRARYPGMMKSKPAYAHISTMASGLGSPEQAAQGLLLRQHVRQAVQGMVEWSEVAMVERRSSA